MIDTAKDDLFLFKAIVEASREAVAVSDPKGEIIYINPAHEKLFGRSLEEARKTGYRSFFPLESLDIIDKIIVPALKKGRTWNGSIDAFNAENRRFSLKVRGYPARNQDGRLLYVFSGMYDASREKAIAKEKALFEKVYNSQPGAILILDDDAPPKIQRVNLAFSRIFRYRPDEALGRPIDFLYSEETDIAALRQKLYPVIEKHGFINLTGTSMKRKDGTCFPVEMSAMPLESEEGEKAGWITVIMDATERKQAENALRDSESKLTLVIDGTPALIAYVDSSLRYVFVNKAYADWYGMSRGDIVGKYIKELLPRDAFDRSLPNYLKVLDGTPVFFENQTVDQNGNIKYVSVRMAPHRRDGEVIGFFASIIDITERKLAEKALRGEFERFASLMDSLNATVYVADMKTHDLLFMNAYARERFGGFAGKKCWEAIWPDQSGPCEFCTNDKLIDDSGNPDGPYVWEARNPSDGQWFQHMDQAIKWPDGRLVRLEIATNITDRKLAEEERNRLEAKQRRLNKAESLNRMAGAIAHRFNNYLSVVTGNLEMAAYEPAKTEKAIRTLDRAFQAIRKAADLSGMMLTYLGQTANNRKPLDLSKLCRQTLPKLKAILPETAEIAACLPARGPMINANREQVQQILVNLVENSGEALKGQAGQIHISVTTSQAEDMPDSNLFPVDWRPAGGANACLEVKDTGCGIPETDMENLFDPFFTTQFTGRGLGLSVVSGIVQAHGGGLTVNSRPNEGSVFRVYIPLADTSVPAPGASITEHAPRPDKPGSPVPVPVPETAGTVLVVDDDELVLDVTQNIVERIGFNVLAADNGKTAVDIFSSHKDVIRLVLSDLSMPYMNGWEMLNALRRIRPDIPVVLTSGYDEAHAMNGEQAESPQAFLKKPYKYKELEKVLHGILGPVKR